MASTKRNEETSNILWGYPTLDPHEIARR
jgi:hypothetical protein